MPTAVIVSQKVPEGQNDANDSLSSKKGGTGRNGSVLKEAEVAKEELVATAKVAEDKEMKKE